MTTHTLRVSLNGTATNPYHRMGLTHNPFMQLGRAEWDVFEQRIAKLGADPIPHAHFEQYIREHLAGFSDEFVTLCVERFRPGELVTFVVNFPDRKED